MLIQGDMPAVLCLEDWEKTLRGQVKGLAAGWSVKKEDRDWLLPGSTPSNRPPW